MGVVKDVASTNGTTHRFDIGKSSDLNTQDSTGGSDSLTPYLTIDNGDVGIGTTSPAYKLDVHGPSNVGFLTTTSVSGNGSGLTSLNADNITSGTLGRPISTTTGTFSGVVTCNDVLKLEAGSTTGDTSVESTHKTITYIRFGTAGAGNDWAYLRQIGGTNLIKLALDFHDDNEARFEIRKVNSSAGSGSGEVATTVFSVDDGAVTATSFSGSGSSLTSLNADNLTSGTVSSDRLSLAASDIPDLSASKITTGTLTRPIDTTTGTFSGRVDSDRYLTSNTFPLPDPNQHSFRHVCMITNSSVPYGLTQAGGCIYEYNPSTGDTVRVVEPVSEPTAGTFTTTAGREYFPMGSPMAIVGEHKMAPFTNLGSLFGFVENRNDPTTAYLYAPYSNVSVEYFHDTSVTGTPTSTIAVPYKTVVSFTCTSASGTNSHIFVVKGGRILMSSTGNGGDDRVLAPLSTIAYGYHNTSFKKDIYLQNDVTTSGKCVYSNQNVPLILSQAGDGDGSDATCGIPFELVADTYIVPHDIRGWMIQFLYTETVVNVAYWSATNSQWEQYRTYSPSGTPSILSPEQLQEGKMGTNDTDINTSHTLWMFTGTKDFTLTVEEYTDNERIVSGFRVHQVAQQIQTNLLDNVVQDSSGNVGIGVTSPDTKFEVFDQTKFNVDVSDATYLKVGNRYSSSDQLSLISAGDVAICSDWNANQTGKNIDFRTNTDTNGGTLLMRIQDDGNVGIGTTSPGYKLHVNGTSQFEAEMRWDLGTRTSHAGYSTNKDWYIRSGETAGNVILQDGGGNVGIGTGSPATLCDLSLASGTDYSNTVALTIRNYSSDYTQIANGFGSRIQFRTNRGTNGGSTSPSADIKGYVYSGAGGTGDYHALDLDVYGDNGSLNKGISILSTSYSGGPANTIMHGNVGIGTADPNALLHIEQTLDPILRIQGTASDSNAYIELRETTGDSYGASLYYEGTSAVQGLRFGHFNGSSTLRTDMAIDRSTGRVGIGITNPLGKLAVLSPLSNIEATDLNSLRSNAAINIGAYGYSNDYLSIGLLGSSANDGNNPSAYIQNRWDGGLAADLLLQPGGGNVGIGTTNPTARLELYSSTLDTNHITVYADNSIITQDRIFVLSDVNGSGLIQMGDRFNNDSTTYKIQLNTEGDSYFSGGNVGIGTTNPETALVVDGTITIRNGSQVNAIRTDSDGNLQFLRNAQTNDTPTITINDETGNVGVGTTNPAYTLDVNGSARVGALTATTGTFSGNVRCNSFTLSQKAGEQGEFIVERKDNGYTQSALPLAHIDAFGISVNIPNVDYTTTSSKLTFTIDDDNTGSRWMLKMLVRDAEGGASVRVNSGTTHELRYNDVPQDPREDNDDSWTTIDITNDVVYAGATNTIYWWAPNSDGSSVRAAYVFPTSGPALPNEPVETDLHLYNGLYVSSNLTVNTDDLFVDTQSGRVGVGTTNPKALLHIEQTLDPILRIQGTAGDSNAYIELRETDSDNYGASLYYEGTSSVQGLRFGHFDGSSTLRTDMAIDRGTGRVGIGTDSPSAPLHVYRDAGVSNFVEVARFETNHGDFDDSTILSDGGYLSFHTNDSNSGIGEVVRIGWRCDNEDNSENDGMLEFYTKRDDTLNRVVTISSDGNIGIGVDKAAVNSKMYISHNEEQNSTQNHFVNVLYATITGSTALTAYRYASGFRTSFETQFSGSSTGARHYVRGVDSYTRATGTANPHYMYGVEGGSRTASTGTISYVLTGGRFYGYQEGTASQPVQSLYGVQAQAYKYGTGDVTYAVGVTSDVITNNGNITNKLGVSVAMTNDGSAITNSYQFKGVTNQTSGSITNIYGLHLSSNQNLDHYMEARDVQWRTQYNTNQVHLHLNKTNAQYAQNMNYTHYATQTSGSSQDPDSSMGLWMGNFTDENYGGRGRNFIAWTSTLQLYRTSDNTDFEDTLSFTSNSDVLNHAGTAFDKVGYFDGTTADSDLNNFTGQHRCLVEEVRHDQAEEHEGLIVCANKNEYFKMSGGTDFTF